MRVVSEGPIGGMLRFDHPDLGVAGLGASRPVSDAIVPVRRQEGGITTGVALHNLESSPELVRCELRQAGVLLDAVSIPSAVQRADGLVPRHDIHPCRYVRLRGVGALRRCRGGAVYRRGPGTGPRQPHLHHTARGGCDAVIFRR